MKTAPRPATCKRTTMFKNTRVLLAGIKRTVEKTNEYKGMAILGGKL
jgi:hypothetical protein